MAGSGFGFSPYPQRPSVNPVDVGQMLQARTATAMQQEGADNGMMGGAAMAAPSPALFGGDESMSDPSSKIGGDASFPSPFHIMAQEMVQRAASLGGVWRGQQQSPATPYDDVQLMQLGISREELALLKATGAVKQ